MDGCDFTGNQEVETSDMRLFASTAVEFKTAHSSCQGGIWNGQGWNMLCTDEVD